MLLIGSFAILNAMLGTWLAWRLLRDEPATVSTLKAELQRQANLYTQTRK